MVVIYMLYSVHAATIFDAFQQRGCHEAARAAPEEAAAAASRIGSVVVNRESTTVRGRAGAGVSILPPEYEFVALDDDDEEEGGGAKVAAAR